MAKSRPRNRSHIKGARIPRRHREALFCDSNGLRISSVGFSLHSHSAVGRAQEGKRLIVFRSNSRGLLQHLRSFLEFSLSQARATIKIVRLKKRRIEIDGRLKFCLSLRLPLPS